MRRKALTVAFVAKLRTTFNSPLEKLPSGASMSVPGIPYTMLLRTGLPNPAEVLKSCDLARAAALLKPELYQTIPGFAQGTPVVAAQRMTIHRAFYNRQAFDWPMEVAVQQASYSKKSVMTLITMFDKADREVLVQTRRQLVLMGPDNKAITFPPDVLKLYQHLPQESMRIDVQQPPINHFRWRMRVRHSDIDLLNHANQSSYLEYSLEGAAEGVTQGALGGFVEDLFYYPLQEAELLHAQEAFAGEELDVRVWKDEDAELTIRSHITKNDLLVCHCKMTFHPLVDAKL